MDLFYSGPRRDKNLPKIIATVKYLNCGRYLWLNYYKYKGCYICVTVLKILTFFFFFKFVII